MSYQYDHAREFLQKAVETYVPDGTDELSDRETLLLSSFLFRSDVPTEMKERVIILMSHLDSVTAFRQLEKYAEIAEEHLRLWAETARDECRMFMEMALTDYEENGEDVGIFLGGGLGGHNNCMRCYFMVLPMPGEEMTDELNAVVETALIETGKEIRVVIEDLFYSKKYLGFTALIPMDVAIAELMETSIGRCKTAGSPIFSEYYACNGEIPDESEIDDIIAIVRES